jgi:ABC-type amino acid transport substrate-binding protein
MSGLAIKNLADMNKFNVCGVKNVDYGTLNKLLKIQEHNTIKDVMFNIKTKECDVFVAEGVVMRYGQRADQYQVPPVGCIRLAGTEKSYHIAVSKHVPNASNFVGQIQQKIGALGKDIAVLAEDYDVSPIRCQQTININ